MMLNFRPNPVAYARAILRGPVSIMHRGDQLGERGWLVPSVVLQIGLVGRNGVNESRSVFVPDGNAPRDSLPAMLIRRAVWAMGQSLPVLPKTSDIKPSAIRLAITHSVTSDRQATKIDTAWNALFRELGSTFRVAAERHNRKRRENATIPIAKGPRYWHSVEADGFAYRWFSGHEKSALSEAWRKLWQPLAGGRKVEAFTERLPWDPLGLSLYVSPKESSKLGKWYIDRLLPAIEELCAHKF